MITLSTHATLLARLGDEANAAAWGEFYARYADLIRGFARRRGLQRADCDDVVQEVLLTLTRAMRTFEYDPRRGRFRGYLKTLTMRAISRRSRQDRPTRPLLANGEAAVDPATAETAWEDEWRRHHVRRALTMLESEYNARDRLAFAEYALAGRSPAEVAAALGMSVDQVYQVKSRVMRRLTAVIAGQVADEG
ncbi:MAG: sigma-70 family RNA polymerase sigma factor [Planctomycetota bacterium]